MTDRAASVYRALLRLYPAEFRARYAEEMVQLFSDQLRDARASGRQDAGLRIWLRAIGDLVVTVISEHAMRNRPMAALSVVPSRSTRALGVVGIIGGLMLLAGLVLQLGSVLDTIRLVLFNVGAIAIAVAVYRRLRVEVPRLALATTALTIVANAVFIGWVVVGAGRPDAGAGSFGLVGDISAIAMWLADALFGVVAFTYLHGLGRWGAAALAIGSLLAPTGLARLGWTSPGDGSFLGSLVYVGLVLAAIGWVVVGIAVASRPVAPAPGSAAATP